MAFKKTFVLSDETVNTYGFWILTAGIDLSAIQKNCPLFYEHRTYELPLGHVENIRMSGKQVLGDIIIDGGNEEELEYIRKIENGDIKGCSFGIDPITWSEEPDLIKKEQTRATLLKCKPFEVSLAPLPGNQNALAMRNGNDMISLSATSAYDFIPDLKTQINMKKIAVLLGMAETATEDQLCEALGRIQLKAGTVDSLQKTIEDTVTKDLPEAQKNFFLSLSKTNMTAALEFLALSKVAAPVAAAAPAAEAAPVAGKVVKIADLIHLKKEAGEKPADGKDNFDYLQRHNSVELSRIRRDEPEKYQELVKGYSEGVRFKA